MPDVLDQSEVDALLAAVDTGTMDLTEQSGGGGETAVSSAEPGGAAESTFSAVGADVEIAIYDFKRPERVSKDQLRSLTALHDGFARNLSASLSGFMRTIVEVELASVEQITYSEFILSLPNPTCFTLLTAEPLDGNMILEINPSIIFPVIDRLLGGGHDEVTIPDRPLTEIELRLSFNIINLALKDLTAMWENIKKILFKIAEVESNPQLVQIVPPNEPVVLIGFEISMGDVSGMMNLCIPYRVIEPVMGEFSTQYWFSGNPAQIKESQSGNIGDGLQSAVLELTAYLAETRVTVKDILELKSGDIITTDKLSTGELLLAIKGKPKFRGTLGKHRGNKAVLITDHADPHDRL